MQGHKTGGLVSQRIVVVASALVAGAGWIPCNSGGAWTALNFAIGGCQGTHSACTMVDDFIILCNGFEDSNCVVNIEEIS